MAIPRERLEGWDVALLEAAYEKALAELQKEPNPFSSDGPMIGYGAGAAVDVYLRIRSVATGEGNRWGMPSACPVQVTINQRTHEDADVAANG